MFKKWFNKTEEVETQEEIQEETQSSNLEDQAGWIVYSVDEDGIIKYKWVNGKLIKQYKT